jgi:hypothetical protein
MRAITVSVALCVAVLCCGAVRMLPEAFGQPAVTADRKRRSGDELPLETAEDGSDLEGKLNLISDFGADPTGQTDSTAAVQAFVDALSAGMGGVIPSGQYSIRKTIVISKSDAILVTGLGGGVHGTTSFRWDGKRNGTVFLLDSVDNSYFTHFAVRRGKGSIATCFAFKGGSNDALLDVECSGSSRSGFQVGGPGGDSSAHLRLEGFLVDCARGDGVDVIGVVSTDQDLLDGTIAGCDYGVRTEGGSLVAENLSFNQNRVDLLLSQISGSVGIYESESIGSTQFLIVDPGKRATDPYPVEIEGTRVIPAAGAHVAKAAIVENGQGPLILSADVFGAAGSSSPLHIQMGRSSEPTTLVLLGNVYAARLILLGHGTVISLGDVTSAGDQLPAELGDPFGSRTPHP